MFLPGLFYLLTGLGLPPCNKELVLIFFDRVDADNNYKVDRYEAETHLDKYDTNHDKHVTLAEAMARVGVVDPDLKGHEKPLFDFVDINQSGIVTLEDIDILINAVDANNDRYMSRCEAENFLDTYC